MSFTVTTSLWVWYSTQICSDLELFLEVVHRCVYNIVWFGPQIGFSRLNSYSISVQFKLRRHHHPVHGTYIYLSLLPVRGGSLYEELDPGADRMISLAAWGTLDLHEALVLSISILYDNRVLV